MAAKSNSQPDESGAIEITDMQPPTPFTQMIAAMSVEATMETETVFAGDDANLIAILNADDDDEIWDADERGPLGFRDLAGCEIAITDMQVKFSRGGVRPDGEEIKSIFVDPSNGRQMYLLCTMHRIADTGDEDKRINLPPIGESFQANTSARYLVAKLWRFYQLGKIDPQRGAALECRVKGIKLGDGQQTVLKLRPVAKRPTVQV